MKVDNLCSCSWHAVCCISPCRPHVAVKEAEGDDEEWDAVQAHEHFNTSRWSCLGSTNDAKAACCSSLKRIAGVRIKRMANNPLQCNPQLAFGLLFRAA